MSTHTLTVGSDPGNVARGATRLTPITHADAQALLLEFAAAVADQAIDIVGGTGPVPSTLNDVRAAQLAQLSRRLHRIPSDSEVRVLFRVLPATAGTITRRTLATYGADLDEHFRAFLKRNATVTDVAGGSGRSRRWKVKLTEPVAYDFARQLIEDAEAGAHVVEESAQRELTFPQVVQVEGQPDLRILEDVLGLARP